MSERDDDKQKICHYAGKLATLILERVRVSDAKTMKALGVQYEKLYEIVEEINNIGMDR